MTVFSPEESGAEQLVRRHQIIKRLEASQSHDLSEKMAALQPEVLDDELAAVCNVCTEGIAITAGEGGGTMIE